MFRKSLLDTVRTRGLFISCSKLFAHVNLYLPFAIVCITANGGYSFAMLLAGAK
jgi:hypothetical protein